MKILFKTYSTVFWFLLAFIIGFSLFYVSLEARHAEENLAYIYADIEKESQRLRMLEIERTHLERPENIQALADKYLDLFPSKAAQMDRDSSNTQQIIAATHKKDH